MRTRADGPGARSLLPHTAGLSRAVRTWHRLFPRRSWHGRAGHVRAGSAAMSFGIYLAGIVLVVCGLVYGAAILHTPVPWIVVGALVALGIGVLAAVKATRQRDGAG